MRCNNNNNNTKQWNAWMPSMTFMKKSNGNEREKCVNNNNNLNTNNKYKRNNNHSMKSEIHMEYFT